MNSSLFAKSASKSGAAVGGSSSNTRTTTSTTAANTNATANANNPPGASSLLSSFLPSSQKTAFKKDANKKTYNTNVQRLPPAMRVNARQAALAEAEKVLTAINSKNNHSNNRGRGAANSTNRRQNESNQNGNSLENFNLLGVVTSPRILEQITASDATVNHDGNGNSNDNGPTNSQSNSNNASSAENGILDPKFFSSMTAMSSTFSKEIESFNSTLFSYSKSYLGTFPSGQSNEFAAASAGNLDFETELNSINGLHAGSSVSSTIGAIYPSMFGEDMIKGQIANEDLPAEILDLDLSSVEAYIRKCGAMAEHLKLRDVVKDVDDGGNDTNHDNGKTNHARIYVEGTQDTNRVNGKNDKKEQNGDSLDPATHSVPEIFFSEYFDLTDPDTFSSLLVLPDNDDVGGHTHGNDDEHSRETDHDIIHIQNPEQFTQHLDTVELALLHQVRSKSSSFFRETNRFTHLKSLVASSVQDVQSLRRELDLIRDRSILDAEMVPIMDKRRKDTMILKQVLQEIEHVVEVKASVGNLIQTGDYLGAVERIHLARRLLDGKIIDNDGNDTREKEEKHVLRKITAMNKIYDQLAQYENLVVMDLSNDLVESFLSWNGRNNGELLTSTASPRSSAVSASKVKNTILAMKKCGKLSTMADIYREKLCDTIRVTIKTTVSECAIDAVKGKTKLSVASATIVSIPENSNGGNESKDDMNGGSSKSSIIEGVTAMSFDQFMECLDMIYDHVLSLLKSAAGVNKFCLEEGISFKDEDNLDKKTRNGDDLSDANGNTNGSGTHSPAALSAGADLSHRSVSELLRLRKETHSLITFQEMRRLWDSCLAFTLQLERISGQKAYVLRSTLLAQAKAFVERKHEANMSSLAAALDTERWTQCDVSADRQTVLDRLCSGRAVLSTHNNITYGDEQSEKQPVATVEGKRYRVVWSCLLLIEMIMSNVACAAHFQTLATNVVGKVSELLRLFNSRSTQLVLGAGAIHSSARLKSINAKHLALVTQCVGVIQSILPHVRAALMAQLPSKQQPLLADLDKIKKEFAEHHDKVLEKFVIIIGGIIEHSLTPRIGMTNFDERGKIEDESEVQCCPFLEGVIINTKKMHQVLFSLLPQEDLMNVFSRIFAHLDSKVPKIFLALEADDKVLFSFPETTEGKQRMIMEVETMAKILNALPDVRPWDFGAMTFLSRRLGVNFAEDRPHANFSQPELDQIGDSDLNFVDNENDGQEQNFDLMEATITEEENLPSEQVENNSDNVIDATSGGAQVGCSPNDAHEENLPGATITEEENLPSEQVENNSDNVINATSGGAQVGCSPNDANEESAHQ